MRTSRGGQTLSSSPPLQLADPCPQGHAVQVSGSFAVAGSRGSCCQAGDKALQHVALVARFFGDVRGVCQCVWPVAAGDLRFCVEECSRGRGTSGEGVRTLGCKPCATHRPGEWDVFDLLCLLHVHMQHRRRWCWPTVTKTGTVVSVVIGVSGMGSWTRSTPASCFGFAR